MRSAFGSGMWQATIWFVRNFRLGLCYFRVKRLHAFERRNRRSMYTAMLTFQHDCTNFYEPMTTWFVCDFKVQAMGYARSNTLSFGAKV